jgi:hypothetical protein
MSKTVTIACAALSSLILAGAAGSASAAPPDQTTFRLFVNPSVAACLQPPGGTATVTAKVVRGALNDTMTLTLKGFKPKLGFDLFTVQRSNQLAHGKPDPTFKNFGLAWYQSDVEVDAAGEGSVTIKTILLDQIFGFDPDVALPPTNTFHVGFWFNRPIDARPCGFTGFTPFNGEHHAGPLAFITRPNAVTKLGPLCLDPNTTTTPATCNP